MLGEGHRLLLFDGNGRVVQTLKKVVVVPRVEATLGVSDDVVKHLAPFLRY